MIVVMKRKMLSMKVSHENCSKAMSHSAVGVEIEPF